MLDLAAHPEDLVPVPLLTEPGGHSRRRFLQGLLVAGGATAVGLPSWMADMAGAATPIGSADGVLVVVTLLGGNDGLNTLAPISGDARTRYKALRPTLAFGPTTLRPVGDGTYGLHPALSRLQARYKAGKVALVRGVGTNGDGSHFATQATMMSGAADVEDVSTGWLGRYADDLPEWDSGFRGVAIGGTVPLHLQGRRVEVTGVPSSADLWGVSPGEQYLYDAVRAMAAAPTGLGAGADASAAVMTDSIDRAGTVAALCGPGLPTSQLGRDLTLAARTINANLGTRCISVCRQDWDTHALQATRHNGLLLELDEAIELFFSQLALAFRNRVTVLVISEFGRRAAENTGAGTDHGAAGLAMVIGDNVKGGMYGEHPSLTTFDSNGNLVPTTDVRSLYASLVGPWLGGDVRDALGASYPDLGLFAARPGQTPTS